MTREEHGDARQTSEQQKQPVIPRPCAKPGCSSLSFGGGLCAKHRAEKEASAEKAPRQPRASDVGRPSSHARGYTRQWRKAARALTEEVGCCQQCGFVPVRGRKAQLIVDHIVPRAEGGSDERANLQVLCRSCHALKSHAEVRARKSAGGRGTKNFGDMAGARLFLPPRAPKVISESKGKRGPKRTTEIAPALRPGWGEF